MQYESDFERELIEYLQTVGNSKQWEYAPEINTIDELWQNFKKILERNNQAQLGSRAQLSETEFAQVKRVIESLHSPYEAGRFIYGLNGVTQVEIDRDEVDAATGSDHVFLTIFDQDKVGSGDTTYQIVNQVMVPSHYQGYLDRRYDVTLLINGLPIIQIEEKAEGHDAREALYQMHQYIDEGLYSGIFSTLQILVGITPYQARYMANTDSESFNEAFAFQWQREKDSKPVYDWREFVSSMLSIPMAHEMSTRYMILDGAKNHKNLMVMRPYQVYATKRVLEAIRHHEFGMAPPEVGYIWHTTGSGKTVSSFKTAWLVSKLPNVNKVIFVVDRVALTKQTYENYNAYDPETDEENKGGVVSNTSSTNVLSAKLKSKQLGNSIIVTSIQKLEMLVQRESFVAPEQNYVFIVDEAHRSTNGDIFPLIKKKFPRSAWVGYTGTPVFEKGLTRAAFGGLLHAYTIREAIADKNVLGFKVDFEHTLKDEEVRERLLPDLLREQYPQWTEAEINSKIARIEPAEVDQMIDSGVYDENPQHVKAVVKDIVDKWRNRSVQGKYGAILTVHEGGSRASAPMVMQYFDEFQRVNEELIGRGKKPLKVAVTFSRGTDNSESQLDKNKSLRRAVQTYNSIFNTSYTDETMDEYFEDVSNRIKGVKEGPKLDIVIVIDQLLTGFDAPKVNTLYVDRTLSGANLIQAYSRTNRIENTKDKPFGTIVNYRWPNTSKQLMDRALAVYSNRDAASYQPCIEGTLIEDEVLEGSFEHALEKTASIVDEISDLTDSFTQIPPSENEQDRLFEAIKRYNSEVSRLKQHPEFDYDNPEKVLTELNITADQEKWVTTTAWYELKPMIGERRQVDYSSLDFRAESIMEVRVTYDYLEELLAQLLNEVHDQEDEKADKTLSTLHQAADQLEDRRLAEHVKSAADAVRSGETMASSYPATSADAGKVVNEYAADRKRLDILNFKKKWGLVDIATANELINAMLKRHIPNHEDLDLGDELLNLTRQAADFYATDAEDESIRLLNKMHYRRDFRHAFQLFADRIAEKYI